MADNFTTFMCWWPGNLGAATSWKPRDLSRPVIRYIYLTFTSKQPLPFWLSKQTPDTHFCLATRMSHSRYVIFSNTPKRTTLVVRRRIMKHDVEFALRVQPQSLSLHKNHSLAKHFESATQKRETKHWLTYKDFKFESYCVYSNLSPFVPQFSYETECHVLCSSRFVTPFSTSYPAVIFHICSTLCRVLRVRR